jgi:hypothetical protein
LHQLLLQGVSYLVQGHCKRDDLLASFAGVYIQDSSRIDLPSSLHTLWQGNRADQATLKLHAVLDYQHGQFDLTLTSGRAHDCPQESVDLPAGSLRLADLGYFKVKVFEQLDRRGVWWVSRLPARAGIWGNGQLMHVLAWLNQQEHGHIDQTIALTAQRAYWRYVCPLR